MYPQNGDLSKSLKSARKKVPQSARLSAGGGCNRYLGNAQIEVVLNSKVLPLPIPKNAMKAAQTIYATHATIFI